MKPLFLVPSSPNRPSSRQFSDTLNLYGGSEWKNSNTNASTRVGVLRKELRWARVNLAIVVCVNLHTSPYTSFIGAKSSFRLDRKTLTLTMPLMSVPADFRIFDMFSRAACWSASIAQSSNLLAGVYRTYCLALDVTLELEFLVDPNAPGDINRLATNRGVR